ncbi:hypothetical protein OG21DRAFT_1513876, partial [Imleria badia]
MSSSLSAGPLWLDDYLPWAKNASEILEEQALEERTQKSARVNSMTSAGPVWSDDFFSWAKNASEILNEQG